MKRLALALALIFTTISPSFARNVDLGRTTSATPYERYMQPVKSVLGDLDGRESDFKRVQKLLRVGRSFRYSFTEPYLAATPEKTAALRAGDCKAKSLWLIDQLNDSSVRYVIGKAHRKSPISHAWVMWNDGARWWILDPTNKFDPIPADRVSSSEYIALYSYGKDGARLHERAQDLASNEAAGREVVADSNRSSKKSGWGGLTASR